ncbi:MAG TPA: deoxyguanosinetriphosphate triphosphohydrolase [Alphaproteobacteria bacterium]|nr:deoxyguanosinetriphosphate triphosphohydrolase [Alphaproteobacteria bacterium]
MDGHLQDSAPQAGNLAVYATKAHETRGRLVPESRSVTRSEFQRDRDRIIHSGGFRKLRNKTQVFIENEGDYYRTRLTHSLEVAQIARSVARALKIDEDLTEAIALAHDLGHTCFGHAGEDGLAAAMRDYGGFSHNEQTFRILTKLEHRYAKFDGLNLTWETLEGVVKHNGPILADKQLPSIRDFNVKFDLELSTFAGPEAQVAAIADDIAYNTHDIDDGQRAGFFRLEDLRELPLFGAALSGMELRYPNTDRERLMHETVREVIGLMVTDLLEQTQANIRELNPKSAKDIRHAPQAVVSFSPAMAQNVSILRDFLINRMYRHSRVNRICAKARHIVQDLFAFFMDDPSCLPNSWHEAVKASAANNPAKKARLIADYIAGMTDRFAVQEHRKLFSTETML